MAQRMIAPIVIALPAATSLLKTPALNSNERNDSCLGFEIIRGSVQSECY